MRTFPWWILLVLALLSGGSTPSGGESLRHGWEPGASMLERNTVVAMYGRSFNFDPNDQHGKRTEIGRLGSLGMYENLEDLLNGDMTPYAAQRRKPLTQSFTQYLEGIDRNNGPRDVIAGLYVVLFSPTRSENGGNALWYLNDLNVPLQKYSGQSVIDIFVKPAQEAGLLVFLDHQLGHKSVAEAMDDFFDGGYLQHDNVHLSFDPEWRKNYSPDAPPLARKIGSIEGRDISRGLAKLKRYLDTNDIDREVIVVFHHFRDSNTRRGGGPSMIRAKHLIKNPAPQQITLVIDFDGIGSPCGKLGNYLHVQRALYAPIGAYAGLKHYPDMNPFEWLDRAVDNPQLTPAQMFGKAPVKSCEWGEYFFPSPALVILD